MKFNEVHFFLGTVITHFLDKPYQEIDFKSYLNSILPYKLGKILSDLHMSWMIFFHFTWLCSPLQWDWKVLIVKVLEMFQDYLNMSHGIMSDFVSILLFWFTLVIKLRNFNIESHWNILIIFDKERYRVRFEYVPWKNIWFCFIFIVWVHFSHKTEKFRFWKSLKYINIFWQRNILRQVSF